MPNAPVALDSPKRCHINRLVARPDLRITLGMGSIEKLFTDPPDSPEGRMARLQVLGLFYFPLKHRRARTAFDTTWLWVKERIFRAQSDAEADATIQRFLAERVVGSPGCAGLPGPTEFAKIRLPGGYTVFTIGGAKVNQDPNYPMVFGQDIFTVEPFFYRDNPVLGKIPLVAKVERRVGTAWQPEKGVRVYFQLVPPGNLPLYMSHREILEQVSPPALVDDRAERIREAEQQKVQDGDPQATNAHRDRGGKRGEPVAGTIFETGEPTEVHPHAVQTKTNEQGEAAVIFSPARMGGDRYRIRAFLDSGEGIETGTLVVWRNLRLSRWVRKEARNKVAPQLVEEATNYGIEDEDDYLRQVGLRASDGRFVGLPTVPIEGLRLLFAEAYCEWEVDGDTLEPESIRVDEYEQARRQAIQDFEEGMKLYGRSYNPNLLFYGPFLGQDFVEETVALLPMRIPWAYNDLLPDGSPEQVKLSDNGLTKKEANLLDTLVCGFAIPGLLRYFSKDGCLPGLTLLQGGTGCLWEQLDLIAGFGGIATHFRGSCITRGRDYYERHAGGPGETFSLLTASHELGHCLFRLHAPGKEPVPGTQPQQFTQDPGGPAASHDPDKCLMGYRRYTKPVFCSKCLLALRGWDIGQKKALVNPRLAPVGEGRLTNLRIVMIDFLSGHAIADQISLIDNDSDWSHKGEKYDPTVWLRGKHSYPITHSMDRPVEMEVCFVVGPAGGSPQRGVLSVQGPEGLSWKTELNVEPNEFTVKMVSNKPLPRKIQTLSFDLEWKLELENDGEIQEKTTGHKIFVTYGKPIIVKDDPVTFPTVKRMQASIDWAKGAAPPASGPMDAPGLSWAHGVVESMMKRFPFYTFERSEKVPDKFNHPWFGNAPWGHWPMLEYAAEAGHCISICSAVILPMYQLGFPGTWKIAEVKADPVTGKARESGDGEGSFTPMPLGISSTLLDSHDVRENQDYPSEIGSCNAYEACIKYTFGGKTLYYGGGAGTYTSRLDVLQSCFSLVWYTLSKKPGMHFHIEKIVPFRE